MALDRKTKIAIAALALVAVLIVAGMAIVLSPTSGKNNSSGKIEVVAAENFWGNLVSQIGGIHVDVLSVVSDPNADPHEYESNVLTAKAVATADFIIINGAGYDTWAENLISSGVKPNCTIMNVADLVGVKEGGNPHLWYDPDYVDQAVKQMENDLIAIDPSDAQYYEQQYVNLTGSLLQYQDLCGEIKENYGGIQVAATESIAEYLANATGLDLISPPAFMEAVAEGNDPPAASIVTFQEQLQSGNVKVLIFNEQTQSAITETMKSLATANNIPIVGITETMPTNGTFQGWMYSELITLEGALNA
jgi:zinc/manganese transport system substrate-binding protein